MHILYSEEKKKRFRRWQTQPTSASFIVDTNPQREHQNQTGIHGLLFPLKNCGVFFQPEALSVSQSPRSFFRTGIQDLEDASKLNICLTQLYSTPCDLPAGRLRKCRWCDKHSEQTGTLAHWEKANLTHKSDWECPELLKQFKCPIIKEYLNIC